MTSYMTGALRVVLIAPSTVAIGRALVGGRPWQAQQSDLAGWTVSPAPGPLQKGGPGAAIRPAPEVLPAPSRTIVLARVPWPSGPLLSRQPHDCRSGCQHLALALQLVQQHAQPCRCAGGLHQPLPALARRHLQRHSCSVSLASSNGGSVLRLERWQLCLGVACSVRPAGMIGTAASGQLA